MLKARAGHTILFGLSARNIELLKQGKPIPINGSDLHLPGLNFVIMYGETEADMENDLRKAGFVIPG